MCQIVDPEKIATALKIQGGFNGYGMPPVLLLITSDIRAFMNNGERNEPFVDGGLFSMSLLYALEAYGLAACPLNAMFSLSQDRQTRALLHIPDYELPVIYRGRQLPRIRTGLPLDVTRSENHRQENLTL